MSKKISARQWLVYIIIGLIGQVAWVIENMYLNTYIFSFGVGESYSTYISITNAASAIVAVLTTMLLGTLSDKIGKRKFFISVGYILWGISTLSFGFIKVTTIQGLFGLEALSAAKTAAVLVIVLDCIMTFFGSTSNDAAFNAYVTETTDSGSVSKVQGVLATFPILAMLIVFGLLNPLTENGNWDLFFYIIGGVTLASGIIGLFLIPKEEKREVETIGFAKRMISGFLPENVKKNPTLYIGLVAFLIYCIASNIFMPYLMIYVQYTMEISGFEFILALGIALIIGAVVTIVLGFIQNRIGIIKMLVPTALLFSVGCILLSLVQKGQLVLFILFATIMMSGYMSQSSTLSALIREYTPSGEEGSYQGLRMIFQVAIPMCTGPVIGEAIVRSMSNATYTDALTKELSPLPPNYIFVFAGIVGLLSLIPSVIMIIRNKKTQNREKGE